MAIEDAKLVLAFAAAHPSFRSALRNDPKGAISDYKSEIKMKNDLDIAELDALVSFSDDDYDSFKRVIEGVGDSLSAEVIGGVLF